MVEDEEGKSFVFCGSEALSREENTRLGSLLPLAF